MRIGRMTGSLALVAALAVAGCSEDPAGPAAVQEDLTLDGTSRAGDAQGPGARAGGVLGVLFRNALREVRADAGEDAVQAILTELRTVRQAAAELRRAGDREGALAKMEEAHLLVATTIVRELGTAPVERLLAAVDTRLSAIDARIEALDASGRDVTRLEARQARIADLAAQARSQDLSVESQAAYALTLAARAYMMASFDGHHGRTDRRRGDGSRMGRP